MQNNLKIKEKAAQQKRHWVRLTKVCNNDCLFCLDKENHNGEIISRDRIYDDLQKGRETGAQRVVLSGGEPTLHPDISAIIREAKRKGYRHVQMITNGRMLAYESFLAKLKKAGLDEVTISFHSHIPEKFEKMTGVKGSFRQTLKGLFNVLRSDLIVNIDIVINKINYKTLRETMQFFIATGVSEFDLLQVIPFGSAWENRKKVFYDVAKGKKYLDRAFDLTADKDIFIWTNRLPAAYLEGHEELIQDPIKLRDEVRGMGLELSGYIEENRPMSCFGERCQYCFLRDFCNDLMSLKNKGKLKAKAIPKCLATQKKKVLREFFFSHQMDIYKFLDFFVQDRYFAKGFKCKQCQAGKVCEGASIGIIRKNGFKSLLPLKKKKEIIVQNDLFYHQSQLFTDQYNFLFWTKGKLKKISRSFVGVDDEKKMLGTKQLVKSGIFYEIIDFRIIKDQKNGLLRKSSEIVTTGDEKKIAFFSYNRNKVRKMKLLEERLYDDRISSAEHKETTTKIGRLFGYPKCCIEFFNQHPRLTSPEINFVLFKKSKSFSWYLNNLDPKVSLIPHLPCRYNCSESIKIAKKYFKCIEKHMGRKAAEELENYLKSPFLYFWSGRFIRLEGYLDGKNFFYGKVFYFEPEEKISKYNKEKIVFKKVLDTVSKGCKVIVSEGDTFVSDEKNKKLLNISENERYFKYMLFE